MAEEYFVQKTSGGFTYDDDSDEDLAGANDTFHDGTHVNQDMTSSSFDIPDKEIVHITSTPSRYPNRASKLSRYTRGVPTSYRHQVLGTPTYSANRELTDLKAEVARLRGLLQKAKSEEQTYLLALDQKDKRINKLRNALCDIRQQLCQFVGADARKSACRPLINKE